MVIANSDSTGTLVSLGNGLKRVESLEVLRNGDRDESYEFRQTSLLLPEDPLLLDDESFHSCCSSQEQQRQPVYMPTAQYGVDEALRCIPQVMEKCDELLSVPPVHFSKATTKERVLYVGQGEVGHATSLQCDVMMSDKATTCHILILRSTSEFCLPLVSCTHIDSASYENCIRDMVQQHIQHHVKAGSCSSNKDDMIELAVHVMGGFEDPKGSSREITNWLMNLIADIAEEEQDCLQATLETCAITSMNESGRCSPIGRGLAIDMISGNVFLAKCDQDVAGPDPRLRSVRLWSSGDGKKLHTIHHHHSNEIRIQPFQFGPFRNLESLLSLNDDVLIRYTSTSPDCEEDDFCYLVRSTLLFLRDIPCRHVFGDGCDQTLVYQRAGHSNTWKLAYC